MNHPHKPLQSHKPTQQQQAEFIRSVSTAYSSVGSINRSFNGSHLQHYNNAAAFGLGGKPMVGKKRTSKCDQISTSRLLPTANTTIQTSTAFHNHFNQNGDNNSNIGGIGKDEMIMWSGMVNKYGRVLANMLPQLIACRVLDDTALVVQPISYTSTINMMPSTNNNSPTPPSNT